MRTAAIFAYTTSHAVASTASTLSEVISGEGSTTIGLAVYPIELQQGKTIVEVAAPGIDRLESLFWTSQPDVTARG